MLFKLRRVWVDVLIDIERELTFERLFVVAVVTQAFKVDVEVIGAARGCTAVLKCVVPSFVKDLVRIISWVREPNFFIYPSLQGGKQPLTKSINKQPGHCRNGTPRRHSLHFAGTDV